MSYIRRSTGSGIAPEELLQQRVPRLVSVRDISSVGRLEAAMAVVFGRWKLLGPAVLFYQLMESCAQVLLFAITCWIIQWGYMLIVWILLWYVPAAIHGNTWSEPLLFPLVCFVPDGFSLLGFSPKPYAPARGMYKIMVGRVLLLLLIIVVALLFSAEIPQEAEDMLANKNVIRVLTRDSSKEMALIWKAFACVIIFLTLLWLIITVHMLCTATCYNRASPLYGIQDPDLSKINCLAVRVDHCKSLDDSECYAALTRLKDEYPSFQLTNPGQILGGTVGFISRFIAEVYAFYLLITSRAWPLAAIMAATLAITLRYLAFQRPQRIFWEAKRSYDRGAHTEGFLRILEADMGGQATPALIIKIIGLPFAAQTVAQALISLGTILSCIGLLALFIFQEFDLGIRFDHSEAIGVVCDYEVATPKGQHQQAQQTDVPESSVTAGITEATSASTSTMGKPAKGDIELSVMV